MDDFTKQAIERDRNRWPYVHMLTDQHGKRMIETVHGSESSLQIEVQASAQCITDAKSNRGGQIATTISVDGLSDSVWQQWLGK